MYWLLWLRSLRGSARAVCGSVAGQGRGGLFQRVRDEGQDLLVLVQQQHGAQVAQALVGEARGSQQLETFYLAEVGSLAEGEEVKELGDIVPPVAWSEDVDDEGSMCGGVVVAGIPQVGVVALFPEAGPDCGAFLLHDGPLVGDGLGRAHVADELLDWETGRSQ